MTKRKTVEDIDDLVAAYGGLKPATKAFNLSVVKGGSAICNWRQRNEVPRGQELGVYLGLQRRGMTPTPKLFGVDRWEDIPGVAVDKRKKERARKG